MTTWHVIGRGFAGWHATGINVRSSGGSLNPYTYWTGEQCKGYTQEAKEGALVYDAQHLEDDAARDAFIRCVVSGPMCDPSLEPNGVNRFVVVEGKEFSALDHVGVAVYESLLRKVPGIKIGRVVNSKVAWE